MAARAPRPGRGPEPGDPGDATTGDAIPTGVADTAGPPAAATTVAAPRDPSLAHLYGRLGLLELRVSHAVARRRAADANPNDRFRGLYVSDEQVDAMLAGPVRLERPPVADTAERLIRIEQAAGAAEAAGSSIRLRALARNFDLTFDEVEILLVALAPDLDQRFERLYAYLQDDVTRRRPGIGLALELLADTEEGVALRSRLQSTGALVASRLLMVDDHDRPFLTRSLRVPDRVTGYLLGDDVPEADVLRIMADPVFSPALAESAIGRTVKAGARLWYVREAVPGASHGPALGGLGAAGIRAMAIDLTRLDPDDDPVTLLAASIREARLRGAALVAGPVDLLVERAAGVIRTLAEASFPIVLHGTRAWDPVWARTVPVLIEADPVPAPERATFWRLVLDDSGSGVEAPASTAAFRLTPEQILRAARAARLRAAADGRDLEVTDIQAGARTQNAAGLERLARRISPAATWADLVVPPRIRAQLTELADRAGNRERVLQDWGMAAGATRGSGLTALFAGDSGTGKTLSAEVVAAQLGLDLYVIDLSTVVDKYIGETEKHLDRIFREADRVNGVLLFDEADAIFGKRSEVKDARDRYANVEIAYLLQRMEQFDGLAVLTTNLRANLDDAFLRRLDVIVDFPMPDEEDRRRLWELHLRPGLPIADNLDLDFLAAAFKISGGNIRNVCLTAAFMAAADRGQVTMERLIRATEREYEKLGRLTVEAEFGRYFASVGDPRQP